MLSLNKKEFQYSYGLLKVLRAGSRSRADFPVLMELQTVNRCSANCPVCPYSSTIAKQPFTQMSNELYERLLDQLRPEDTFQIMVFSFQNEPFVDPTLLAKAKRFKELMPKKRLEVVTNGSLLKTEDLPEVYKYFDLVSISVNGHSQKVYEEVMAGLDWNKTQNLLKAIAARPEWREKTMLRFIKQKANHVEYRAFKKYWNQQGFLVFGFDINNRVGSVVDFDALKIPDSLARKARSGLLKVASRLLVNTCAIPFISFYVRATGDVVLCFNDYSDKYILGNVNTQTVREIFNSPKWAQIRAEARAGKLTSSELCRNCNLYREGIWLTV